MDFQTRNMTDPGNYKSGDKKEDGFRRVCRGEVKGVFDGNYTQPSVPKCHLLHHNDPYLSKLKVNDWKVINKKIYFYSYSKTDLDIV